MRVIIAATIFAAALGTSSALAQGMGMGKGDAYCLKTSAGAMNCDYKTMAECEKAKTGNSDTCMKNSSDGKMNK